MSASAAMLGEEACDVAARGHLADAGGAGAPTGMGALCPVVVNNVRSASARDSLVDSP